MSRNYSSAAEKDLSELASREQLEKEARVLFDKTKIARQPRRRRKPKPGVEDLEESTADEYAAIQKIESELERSNFDRSVLVKRCTPTPYRSEAREGWREHYRLVSAQLYHERHRENVGGRAADWREVMKLMAQNTPEEAREWIEDGMKIEVRNNVLTRILDRGGDETIGSIRRRTGAAIKVSRDESTLLVSGTRQAINRATEEFRGIVGKITITRLYSPLGPGEIRTEDLETRDTFWTPPLTREEGAYWRRRWTRLHMNALPKPSIWTPKSLEDHVTALVETSVERPLHVQIYGHRPRQKLFDHERATVRRLREVFQTAPLRTVASCSALKIAFSYLCEKGDKYLDDARHIFVLMDRQGLRMDTDVFNLLLRAAVKMRNLRKFRQTLSMMLQRGHAPNLDTWLLFLRLFESAEVRLYILQTMHAKNLLGTSEAIERVAQEMATLDADHAFRTGKDLPTFLREQEERYSRSWLTRDAGNRVLDVLSAHGRFSDAFALLDKMAKNYALIPANHVQECLAARPDVVSFNTIISHAKMRGKMPLAVNTLRKMKTGHLARQPDVVTLHLLFEMAWKMRMRTSIVVLWRYAVLAKSTSWRMRIRVAGLLTGNVAARSPAARASNQRIPTLSVHTALGGEALARELAGGARALERLRALVARFWGTEPEPPHKIAALAAKTLLRSCAGYSPSVPLGTVLAQAVLVDLRCMQAKKKAGTTLRDLMASAKVKRLTLWKRRPVLENGWVDLAPVMWQGEDVQVSSDSQWRDEWNSEGWDVPKRVWVVREDANHALKSASDLAGDDNDKDPKVLKVFVRREETWSGQRKWPSESMNSDDDHDDHDDDDDDGSLPELSSLNSGEVSDMDQSIKDTEPRPAEEKQLVIINPRVWADDHADEEDRTELQLQNEEAILQALKELHECYESAIDPVVTTTERKLWRWWMRL